MIIVLDLVHQQILVFLVQNIINPHNIYHHIDRNIPTIIDQLVALMDIQN